MTKIRFSVENFDLLLEENDSQFATGTIQAFASGKNLNDFICEEDTLRNTAHTLYNKPILYSIDNTLDDFFTHIAPDKSLICGFVVPNSAEFSRLPDSRLALNVKTKIWKRYAPKVIELFKRDNGNKKVSVEMELFESSPAANNFTNLLSFAYTGICILGSYIKEAVPGSNIQLLSFSEDSKQYQEDLWREYPSTKIFGGTRPYSNLKDINPVLRGVVPALSLEQANSISMQSFSLGEYGGLANAITKFKNSHKVEFGRWVEKEINMAEEVKTEVDNSAPVEMATPEPEEMAAPESAEMATPPVEEMAAEKDETPAEEKAETPAEEKKEKEDGTEKKFGLPDKFSDKLEKMSTMFSAPDEDEDVKMAAEELKKGMFADPGTLAYGLYCKMCKMADDMVVMAAENDELKKFKADVEGQQKAFAIEFTLKELSEKVVIPQNVRDEMVAEAENYSYENIENWKMFCKAKSFDFALKSGNKSDVVKVAQPFAGRPTNPTPDLWATKI